MIVAIALQLAACAETRQVNPRLAALERGRWVAIHRQSPNDPVRFERQWHAGSALDVRRGRIVVFGSNTHGRDWSNSPRIFDLARLEWTQPYPNDDPSTYRVNGDGIPVAGEGDEHPWAMHSFGSVEYDPARDEIVVSSYPAHMVPGRFSDALAAVWPLVRRHPTWTFGPDSGQWRALSGAAEQFFPYATTFDSDRGVVIGYKATGVFELTGKPRRWVKRSDGGLLGWHNNAVYDSLHEVVVVFGTNGRGNDVVVFDPSTGRHERMPTPGMRPPPARHTPMAFHTGIGMTVVLAEPRPDETGGSAADIERTETWLYDSGADSWERLDGAMLPFRSGMNYNLHYDPLHDLLVLVGNPRGEPTTVWALRI